MKVLILISGENKVYMLLHSAAWWRPTALQLISCESFCLIIFILHND